MVEGEAAVDAMQEAEPIAAKVTEAAVRSSGRVSRQPPNEDPQSFNEHDSVRAIWGAPQGTKRYPGVISKVLGGDTYTVTFDDGDEEDVHARYILLAKSKLHDNTTPPDGRRGKKRKALF